MSEENYRKKIVTESKGNVIWSRYDDFDSDGSCEMFALVSLEETYSYSETIDGELWFVNLENSYKLEENYPYFSEPDIYTFEKNTFIALEVLSGMDSVSLLWGVRNGEPFQPSLTSKGNGFDVNEYNEIVMWDSDYKAMNTVYDDETEFWLGHTWNPYFYYWDDEDFKEYGAMEITIKELLQIEGAAELIDYIKNSDANINSIYYRDNNIIQINYQNEEREENYTNISHYNIMFRYKGKKVELDQCTISEGYFMKSLNSSLAAYPTEFNIDGKK